MVRYPRPLQTDHMAEELWCISPNKGETFQFSPCLLFFKIEMPYFTGHKFTYHKIHHLREHNSVILIWNQRFDRLKAKQALHKAFHVCSGPQTGLQGHVSSGTIELGSVENAMSRNSAPEEVHLNFAQKPTKAVSLCPSDSAPLGKIRACHSY